MIDSLWNDVRYSLRSPLLTAAGLFVIVGASAGLWPAYRASTIDPMIALRDD